MKVWAVFPARHISAHEISFKYFQAMLLLRRDQLENERENEDTEQLPSSSENYTIFHALIEAMTEKEKKESKRSKFLRRLRLSK